jgi:hypothetical protein
LILHVPCYQGKVMAKEVPRVPRTGEDFSVLRQYRDHEPNGTKSPMVPNEVEEEIEPPRVTRVQTVWYEGEATPPQSNLRYILGYDHKQFG